MRLQRLKLTNIRSYKDQTISFPNGSSLLSGDIGVGKSTILLAIEFALFGISRELPGAALLRNGEQKGSIELSFCIDDKEITVRRNLKRGASVTQDYGHIIVNGKEKIGTATELKQEIINLLHYPPELLTKSKSLLYRYTVFTPQEEMKRILVEDKQDRLETLRKVFGVDKYKTIANNAVIFIGHIKSRIKELTGITIDLDVKLALKKEKDEDLFTVTKEVEALLPHIVYVTQQISTYKEKARVFEKTLQEVMGVKKEIAVQETKKVHIGGELQRNQQRLQQLTQDVTREEQATARLPLLDVDKRDMLQKQQYIVELENKLTSLRNGVQEQKTLKTQAERNVSNLNNLDICPLCKQDVAEEHKITLNEKEQTRIVSCDKIIYSLAREEQQTRQTLTVLKESLDDLKTLEKDQALVKMRLEALAAKKKEQQSAQELVMKLIQEQRETVVKHQELTRQLANFATVDESYARTKQELELLQEKHKNFEIQFASTRTRIKDLNATISMLEEDIVKKQTAKQSIDHGKQLQHWLVSYFIPLMTTMEKRIMARIHHDFDTLFQKWFTILIDTEILQVTLDEEFTPIIEQNGYDITYDHLSGGEKTSVALAYRLALNQTINNLVSMVKTKDLIILDEPTDGFSTEQLDRLRLVLDELRIGQIILVSHESKIESFVDHVLRLDKREHVSRILD